MPDQAPRQSYRATSNTVAYWVLVGVVVYFVRPLIPPDINRRLVDSTSGFVRVAASQKVNWLEVSPSVFAQSRESGKPIFLLIGTEWSDVSQDLDNRVFKSADVAERLNRDFIPVRLDAQVNRAWSSSILQLTRATEGLEPHSQLLFLSGTGNILRMVDVTPDSPGMNDVRFISILDEVRFPALESSQTMEEREQGNEVKALVGGSERAVPDPDAYRRKVVGNLSDSQPGFELGRSRILPSRDYVFLVAAGEQGTVRRQVNNLLARPAFAWRDGAFFRAARDRDWSQVTLSESAGRNADMLEVIGCLTRFERDSIDRMVGDRVFACLADKFLADGRFYAASYSRLGDDRRSSRYSVPSSKARRLFGPAAGRAGQVLGLDPSRNPLLVPHATKWPLTSEEAGEFLSFTDKLRQDDQQDPAIMAGASSLDVGTRVVTALLRYAALAGRQDLLVRAYDAARLTQVALVGTSDVRHSDTPTATESYLGDYLNYAEQELMLFRLFGDTVSLDAGRRVLDRAETLFNGAGRGVVYNAKFAEYGSVAEEWVLPKLVDDDLPATCGQMAYLLRAYASLEGNPAKREEMRAQSDQILRAMAPAASKISRQVATFFLAAQLAEADMAVFCVGPDCVAQAREWDALADLAWSYPALVSVRPDIQARGPGYYVESRGVLRGPLTRDQVRDAVAQRRGAVTTP